MVKTQYCSLLIKTIVSYSFTGPIQMIKTIAQYIIIGTL